MHDLSTVSAHSGAGLAHAMEFREVRWGFNGAVKRNAFRFSRFCVSLLGDPSEVLSPHRGLISDRVSPPALISAGMRISITERIPLGDWGVQSIPLLRLIHCRVDELGYNRGLSHSPRTIDTPALIAVLP